MASQPACCTCASVLTTLPEAYDSKSEKPIRNRTLSCCGRTICASCIDANPRFAAYCPFCQTTRLPATAESLRDAELPPPYSSLATPPTPAQSHTPPPAPHPHHATLAHPPQTDDPPAYTPISPPPLHDTSTVSSPRPPSEDVIHYLTPDDSLQSLSLAYRTPAHVLRSHNKVPAEHLLSARRTIRIPAAYYQGPSLSPNPLESKEEQERKTKIRKFMVQCKVSEYKVAVLYLDEATWDLEKAVDKWKGDERWEAEHPLVMGRASANKRGKRTIGENLSPERIARLLS